MPVPLLPSWGLEAVAIDRTKTFDVDDQCEAIFVQAAWHPGSRHESFPEEKPGGIIDDVVPVQGMVWWWKRERRMAPVIRISWFSCIPSLLKGPQVYE